MYSLKIVSHILILISNNDIFILELLLMKTKSPSLTLGTIIRQRRIELRLTQAQLASKVKLSQNAISFLETQPVHIIDTPERIRLYNFLGIDYRQYLIDPPTKTEFGVFIRKLRKEKNLSPRQVANAIKVSLYEYKALETSENPFLSYSRMRRLVAVLGGEGQQWAKFFNYSKETKTNSKIGSFIRRQRKALGLSCVDLAKRLKTTRQAVSYIELNGLLKRAHPSLIEKWAVALEVDPVEFASHI